MSKPYFVCVEFNTEADGTPVPEHTNDEDIPRCYYGPFEDVQQAVSWMDNDYPDGDTDVYDMYEFQTDDEKALGFVNTPQSIHGDIPDEDIRDDSRELHAP